MRDGGRWDEKVREVDVLGADVLYKSRKKKKTKNPTKLSPVEKQRIQLY